MRSDAGTAELDPVADALAKQVLAGYDAAEPFGYRYQAKQMRVAPNRPGFLEGAAGIALALLADELGSRPDQGLNDDEGTETLRQLAWQTDWARPGGQAGAC